MLLIHTAPSITIELKRQVASKYLASMGAQVIGFIFLSQETKVGVYLPRQLSRMKVSSQPAGVSECTSTKNGR
jgi:hypothetical protein